MGRLGHPCRVCMNGLVIAAFAAPLAIFAASDQTTGTTVHRESKSYSRVLFAKSMMFCAV